MPQHPFTAEFEDSLLELLAEEQLESPVVLASVHADPFVAQITVQRGAIEFRQSVPAARDFHFVVPQQRGTAFTWQH